MVARQKIMKWLDWTNSGWRRRAFLLATTVLIVGIASNPELAAFVPMLDAFGLDVLLYLMGTQLVLEFRDLLAPFSRHACKRWIRSATGYVFYPLGFCIGGYCRQLVWHIRHAGIHGTVFGPGSSPKPVLLCDSARSR
jgi:hypothetical protein